MRNGLNCFQKVSFDYGFLTLILPHLVFKQWEKTIEQNVCVKMCVLCVLVEGSMKRVIRKEINNNKHNNNRQNNNKQRKKYTTKILRCVFGGLLCGCVCVVRVC